MDILLNKGAIVERCIRRVREEVQACPKFDNFTHLDALILNLERACQAVIDMAMHQVACHHLGMPQGSAQAFDLLAGADMLTDDLARAMKGMVGFRNIAIHEYRELDFDILRRVVGSGLDDLVQFCRALGVNIKPF